MSRKWDVLFVSCPSLATAPRARRQSRCNLYIGSNADGVVVASCVENHQALFDDPRVVMVEAIEVHLPSTDSDFVPRAWRRKNPLDRPPPWRDEEIKTFRNEERKP